jgi:hypothetical protein
VIASHGDCGPFGVRWLNNAISSFCACGRLCLCRKRIDISSVLAGQRLGIKEVDDGIGH